MPNQEGLIIIPTYNERDNITKLIEQILYLPILVDILIIDDNSPDGTGTIVEDFQAKLRIKLLKRSGKLGLGTAYIEGFKIALNQDYKFIITMDADFLMTQKYSTTISRRFKDTICHWLTLHQKWWC
jgi:dolichol-phosphate mannosyltransferase